MTTRRDALIAMPLLCAGFGASAQAPKSGRPRRIGILQLADPSQSLEADRALSAAMSKLGWIVGDNVVVERASADWKEERLTGLAEELIRKRVEVILTYGITAPIAAARATRTIPIVFFGVNWPVEQGLIDSFARPRRNVTGVATYTGIEVTHKRLEFLRAIAPAAKRLAWVWPENLFALETVSGGRVDMIPALAVAAKDRGYEARFHAIRKGQDLDALFRDITSSRAQAITYGGSVEARQPQKFAELVLRYGLPSAFFDRDYVEAGGLLSYGVPDSEYAFLVKSQAEYVDRIPRGARPGDLPVELPRRYELVINTKTAKALGLTIPQSVLARADELIQ